MFGMAYDGSMQLKELIHAAALAQEAASSAGSLGYRLPPESDGYDGDGQGGQFGASAASPPRNARRRRKKCEF